MPAVASNERFGRPCVESRGRLRAGSEDHASAWRLPDGCFGWRLDADDERVGPGPPGTRTGWTTRASRSAAISTTGHGPSGSTAGYGSSSSTASHGASGGTASHGASSGTASHGASRRAGIPSPFRAAAAGNGATSGAAHRITATAPEPTIQCPASRPAGGGAAARIPPPAGSATTSGHGAAADAAYRHPFAPKCTPGRERAIGTAAPDAFAPIRGTPRPHRPLAAARAAIAIAEDGRPKGATAAATVAAVAEPPS
ncbi:hypothetical protein AB7M16_006307 [Bradyrhizobium sp. USDA 372]